MEEDKELQEKLFGQPQEVCPEVLQKTVAWSKKAFDPETCFVCRQPFDLSTRMARILVQCGHSLCTTCLLPVTRHATSRCPLCLGILMNVAAADRMPPNPQSFSQLFTREKLDVNVQTSDKEDDSDTKRVHSASRQESCEFETCELHHAELKHYFCVDHRNLYCKHCAKLYHAKEKCRVVDVYEIEEDEDFSQLLGEHAK